ncbi:MAG TPA: hypothetical protein VEB64_08570, partial [Azospirillaceae bacterium]|nr:hypothetical protein [Azospirillaceae bacterium]
MALNPLREGRRIATRLAPRLTFLTGMLLAGTSLHAIPAFALDLKVSGPEGEAIGQYRWVLEEDVTYRVTPGTPDPNNQSTRFHKSHMPVVAAGDETTLGRLADPAILSPGKRYFLSVRAESGYTLGGGTVLPGEKQLEIVLNKLPLPTAQISIFAFEDNQEINNAPDQGEQGLEGFTVILSEAGGRYGQNGGQVLQDAFGNPLGTTYDENGGVVTLGTGEIRTGPDGRVVIKNLVPAKYGVNIKAPDGWVQTTTIEGTRTIDAWVKANEPEDFIEFGPPEAHVFMGFVRPIHDTSVLTGGPTITGQVVNKHMSALPSYVFEPGGAFGHTTCWIGLNSLAGGIGKGVYAQRCHENGHFTIPDVPPGAYQLVVWDDYLDIIINFSTVTVNADGTCNADGSCDLGKVPVFNWFHRMEHTVFLDMDEDGFRDCVTAGCNDVAAGDEIGLAEQAVNLRFRDGTMYQSFATDHEGFVPFDEVFPFFAWQVAEVDFARHKATGVTVIVDAGGPVQPDAGWEHPSRDQLTPQTHDAINPHTGNALSRTKSGPILTQAFQGFLGQTNVVEWGKKPYGPGENGGISGIVYYAVTRAEDDPRYAAADPWEPGVPRVQVNLYRDADANGVIDDLGGDGAGTLADVDNYPFGWRTGGEKGANDVDHNGNGVFDAGDAVQITTTDSWDDNLPAGCLGPQFVPYGTPLDCFDGMRNWNQVTDGV